MTRTVLLLAALALATIPLAEAHTTAYSTDGKVRVVVGLLEEPVVTYQKTGLDVCFTQNTTAREPATVNPGALTATLRSPSGESLQLALRAQFGRAGCFQFEEPFVLTEPGQYLVDLQGDAAGSPVSLRDVKAGGAVLPVGNITFPAPAPDTRALQASVDALQARVQALESEGHRSAPASGLMALAAIAAVALLARRKAQ